MESGWKLRPLWAEGWGGPAEEAIQKMWDDRYGEFSCAFAALTRRHVDYISEDPERRKAAKNAMLVELQDFQDTDEFIELAPADADKYNEFIGLLQDSAEDERPLKIVGNDMKEIDTMSKGVKVPAEIFMITCLAYMMELGKEEIDIKKKVKVMQSLPTAGTQSWWQLMCGVYAKGERVNAKAVFISPSERRKNVKRADLLHKLGLYLGDSTNIPLRQEVDAMLLDDELEPDARSIFTQLLRQIDDGGKHDAALKIAEVQSTPAAQRKKRQGKKK